METVKIINLSFHLWGIILSMAVIMCLLGAKKLRTKEDKLYFLLLLCNMLAMAFDAASLLLQGDTGRVAWFTVRIANYLQFAIGNLLPFILILYLVGYIEEIANIKISERYKDAGAIVLIISEIYLTGNLLYPYLYDVDQQNVFVPTAIYPIMYIPRLVMLIISTALLIKHWKNIKRNAAISFLVYSFIPFVSVLLTLAFYGIAFGYIGATVALIGICLYLEFERGQKVIIQSVTGKVEQLHDYEKLVNEGMKISMKAEDPNENINAILKYLGEMLDGDRVYIFEKNDENGDDNTYEWCAEGIEPQIDSLQNVSYEVCAPWYEIFQENQVVTINSLESIKDAHPLIYEALQPQNVDTLLTFPLWNNNRMIGFFGIDNPPKDILSMPTDILEIIANFIVALFKKRDLIRELRTLSYTDAATGAQNRLAMYKYFETLRRKRNIGVMFCDITGLKETNDTRGHGAGDELLQDTYTSLIKGFDRSNIFRVGGDEFVVLCSELTENEFAEKVSIVRKAFVESDVNVAIGTEWRDWVAETVKQTIAFAEKQMYSEKSAWYIQKGKDRRGL